MSLEDELKRVIREVIREELQNLTWAGAGATPDRLLKAEEVAEMLQVGVQKGLCSETRREVKGDYDLAA